MSTPLATKKLTVRLPQDDLQFIKRYAKKHNVTVTELVKRYFGQLRQSSDHSIDPRLLAITGLLPKKAGDNQEYYDHLEKKHQ